MRRLVVAFVVIVLVLPALLLARPASAARMSAAPSRLSDVASREDILGWINSYRKKPDPDRVPVAMRGLSRLGLLNDPEGSGVYVGFLAGVLGANPSRAEALIAKTLPLKPEHEWAIVRAVAYSGLPDWQKLLQRIADRMPERRVMIEKLSTGKLPTLEHAQIEKDETLGEKLRGQFTLVKYFHKVTPEMKLDLTPDLLDTLWGYYYATANYRPLSRIILMLRWTTERDVLEKLTLGNMAKYTLAINSARNPDLLASLKWAAAQKQPEGVAPVLKEVIEAAETFETARLRNEALASIDELKRKGPGVKRDISMWGQVGEGALAVGCIVAAATGHIELGLPCVVTGGISSAALSFWDRQP
ncbi:MAG: hypothetical protein QOK01_450 [Alphaproteobacteria bacterium]|nr:hypothetical protein [Alphaproteobacteria bacterium]